MQLLVLLLIISVLIADSGLGSRVEPADAWSWAPLLVAIVPTLLGLLLELVLVRRTLAQASRGAMDSILRASARLRLLQWIAVLSTVFAVIGMGWLELLRATLGDLVVIDEVLAILPALALICLLWIVQWPVERMLREAVVMRRLDRGLPVHPVPTAGRHLLVQARANLLVVLVPAVFVLACVESAEVGPDLLGGPVVGRPSYCVTKGCVQIVSRAGRKVRLSRRAPGCGTQ